MRAAAVDGTATRTKILTAVVTAHAMNATVVWWIYFWCIWCIYLCPEKTYVQQLFLLAQRNAIMASKGMLTGLWRQVERILLKRELVGIDALGNQYYRVWAKDDFGGLQEKRICKPQNSDPSAYTPESMPTEWSSWLRRQRREPPTEEEIERYAGCDSAGTNCVPNIAHSNDAARAAMRQRVALLEAEDLKRRLQVQSRGFVYCLLPCVCSTQAPFDVYRLRREAGTSRQLPNPTWGAFWSR